MKTQIQSSASGAAAPRNNVRAAVNVWWLLLVFCMGLAAGGYWLKKSFQPAPATPEAAAPAPGETILTAATQEVLQQVAPGVEIRFYRLLNEGPGTAPLLAFATRAGALVDEFGRASAGKIAVTTWTDAGNGAAREAALAEGLAPLRLGRSEPDLLGIVVSFRGEKVVLSPLNPKWEGALEFDLARALARLRGEAGTGELAVNPAPVNAGATAELRRILPELDSLPLDQARQQLLEVARADFKVLVTKMQEELQATQQRVTAAGDAAAARQELQQLQLKQAEQLNEIPRRTQAQLELLARIKK
jgi:hypothetical protein